VRINLSEQTDLLDLLGSDFPVPGSEVASFQWCDGVLLRAMRSVDWVLLDEINLAPQATLEGLNALLDHRREVFLPAIGQTIPAHPGFRLFAAQNPVADGGGRKGLPRSFLNRFTRVVLASLSLADLRHICQYCYGDTVESSMIDRAVDLIVAMGKAATGTLDGLPDGSEPFQGSFDWDWNLRDALRLCKLLQARIPLANSFTESARLLLVSRLQRDLDKHVAMQLICKMAPEPDGPLLEASASFRQGIQLARSMLGQPLYGVPVDKNTPSEPKGTVNGEPKVIQSVPDVCAIVHSLQVAPGGLQIGTAALPKRLGLLDLRCQSALEHWEQASHLEPLKCQRAMLHTVAHAVSDDLNCPVLLVGNPAVGKRSIIRWLAGAVGMPLQEVPLTPAMDASELLGCFEQVDARDRLKSFVRRARQTVEATLRLMLTQMTTTEFHNASHKLIGCFRVFSDMEMLVAQVGPIELNPQMAQDMLSNLQQSWDWLNLSKSDYGVPMDLESLKEEFARVCQLSSKGARFEWVDGPLVSALMEGRWVLISHAEHAAPAVLDRLNSLL